MKRFNLIHWLTGTILLLVLHTSSLFAQPPAGFTYQAVARDESGTPLIAQELTVRMQIRADNETGTIVWQEDHAVVTNEFGLFSLAVGDPDALGTPGTAESFSEIDWSATSYFLAVLVKTDLDFTPMGASPILTVPMAQNAENARYAVSAGTAGNADFATIAETAQSATTSSGAIGNFLVQSDKVNDDGEALFEVKRSDGSVAFAVYEDMVWVYVDTSEAKGIKGGFAVGGYSSTKAPPNEFLRVTPDSIRMYIRNNPSKGVKGGFAVGGYSDNKSDVDNFMTLTPENYFIGHNAGINNTSGMYNSVLGYEAAMANTEGKDNVFIGYQAGHSNVLGLENVFIGKQAGFHNIGEIQTEPYYLSYGSLNVFIGNEAGYNNVSGWTNLFLGNGSGYSNIGGSDNTFIGNLAGQYNKEGKANTYVGTFSGRANTEGDMNVCLGFYAGNTTQENQNTYIGAYSGETNINGQNNTFIGANSGQNSEGFGNVFIGKSAGRDETGNNLLYIANTQTTTPLIWGNFSTSRLVFNGTVGIGGSAVTGYALYVYGDAFSTGEWQSSDQRLKTTIRPVTNALEGIMHLHGIRFAWNQEAHDRGGYGDSDQIGLLAQEVRTQFPELVKEDGEGYLSVSYSSMTAVLVEAIKEQQKQLDDKDSMIRSLEERLSRLEARMEKE
jgi:hypothetical protein